MHGQTVLGKYKVTRLLDEGGMSKVYLARQTDRERDVAVKVLKESLRGHTKACEHFRREIFIMSRFKHPHAVASYDAAPNERSGPVLVMDYLRGGDLNTLLQRDKRFSPERTGRLLAQLGDVLDAAHQAGIVHRDIKPGNLIEMLTGRRPFEHSDVEELMLAHADDPPPSFAERGLKDPLPPGLEAVVRSCLPKDPGQANRLTITLVIRSGGLVTPEWRTRCGQIGRDLQAYLMGR